MRERIQLRSGTGEAVEGIICRLEQRHLNDVLGLWRPLLATLGETDAFWDWVMKQRLSLEESNYEAYAVEVEQLTQGLLWLETQQHGSQMDREERLVYVAAIASAPWNRRQINPEPYLRGVGTILLQFARQRSLALGYGGRIALHALPGSESFYEARNMLSGGADPDYDDMIYYEYGVLNRQRRES